MDVAQHLGPLGLAQEGDHRDDDQQGFESLAQQDGEGAQEGRCSARRVRGQGRLGVVEQTVEHLDARGDLVGGATLLERCPELAHGAFRSEEHTSELQSLMRISYAVFCLKKKNKTKLK